MSTRTAGVSFAGLTATLGARAMDTSMVAGWPQYNLTTAQQTHPKEDGRRARFMAALFLPNFIDIFFNFLLNEHEKSAEFFLDSLPQGV